MTTTSTTHGAQTPPDLVEWLGQRCAAANELWALGYTPESYAILHHALRDAAPLLHGAREIPGPLLAEVDGLLAEAEALNMPLTRADFSRGHGAWLERARQLSHRLRRTLTRSRRADPRRNVWLIAGTLAMIAAVAAGYLAWQRRVYAFAPESYVTGEFPARHAIDGQRATEWLLPDGKAGDIDLSLATRQPVHAVTIINSHNRQYMDRAIKKATILVFDDDREVDRAEVKFEGIEPRPEPKRIALRGDRAATRVRISITEHHGVGGGIAEVAIE